MKKLNYSILPEHMQDGARRYIEDGVHPGSFLEAVLANDLLQALRKADDINMQSMQQWGRFLYEIPAICHGSYEKVNSWCDKGGLVGQERLRVV